MKCYGKVILKVIEKIEIKVIKCDFFMWFENFFLNGIVV